MEIKSKFGKYKVADVDSYLARLNSNHAAKIETLEKTIDALNEKNAELQRELDKYKEKEGVIAKVMLDATVRAKEIEEDYRKRADESDAACKQLHDEWVGGMQSAAANLAKMRAEAKRLLEEIDGQFGELCSWADTRLESLEKTSLPVSLSDGGSIESEIAKGADADLEALCREMNFSGDAEAVETIQPEQAHAEPPFSESTNAIKDELNNELDAVEEIIESTEQIKPSGDVL